MTKHSSTIEEALGITPDGSCARHPEVQIYDESSKIISSCEVCSSDQEKYSSQSLSLPDPSEGDNNASEKEQLFDSLLLRFCQMQNINTSDKDAAINGILLRQMLKLEHKMQQQETMIKELQKNVQKQQTCIQDDLKLILQSLRGSSVGSGRVNGSENGRTENHKKLFFAGKGAKGGREKERDKEEKDRDKDRDRDKNKDVDKNKVKDGEKTNGNDSDNPGEKEIVLDGSLPDDMDRRTSLKKLSLIHPSSIFASVRTMEEEPAEPVNYKPLKDEGEEISLDDINKDNKNEKDIHFMAPTVTGSEGSETQRSLHSSLTTIYLPDHLFDEGEKKEGEKKETEEKEMQFFGKAKRESLGNDHANKDNPIKGPIRRESLTSSLASEKTKEEEKLKGKEKQAVIDIVKDKTPVQTNRRDSLSTSGTVETAEDKSKDTKPVQPKPSRSIGSQHTLRRGKRADSISKGSPKLFKRHQGLKKKLSKDGKNRYFDKEPSMQSLSEDHAFDFNDEFSGDLKFITSKYSVDGNKGERKSDQSEASSSSLPNLLSASELSSHQSQSQQSQSLSSVTASSSISNREIFAKSWPQEISSLTLDPEIEGLDSANKTLIKVVKKRLKDKYGEEGSYSGTLSKDDGVPEGLGKMEYDNVRYYEGEWKIGRWHGKGYLVNPNGDTYHGEFIYDARHGHGMYEFKNGDVYDGDFSQDKRHGNGTFMFKNGNVYKGEHVQGKFEGYGRYNFKGGYYEGEWEDGRYEGLGTLQYADGGNYTGGFVNGIAHGQGEETFPDGTKRRGVWKAGRFQRPKSPPLR